MFSGLKISPKCIYGRWDSSQHSPRSPSWIRGGEGREGKGKEGEERREEGSEGRKGWEREKRGGDGKGRTSKLKVWLLTALCGVVVCNHHHHHHHHHDCI